MKKIKAYLLGLACSQFFASEDTGECSPPVSLESSVYGGQLLHQTVFNWWCDRVAFSYCDLLVVVQLLSRVLLFVTPRAAAHQASLSSTNSQSLLKILSIESVMPSNHLILCHPFPASGYFPVSQFFPSGGQMIRASASAWVLLMNIQDWSPLGLSSLIFLHSNRLSRVFSNTTVQEHQFFGVQPSLWSNSHIPTWLLEKP